MGVTHSTVVVGANDASKEVSKNAWNDDHAVDLSDYAGAALPSAAIPQLAHSSLSGLGGLDHPEYVTAAEVLSLLAPDWYTCDSLTMTKGTVGSGTHTDLHVQDGTLVRIDEAVGAPGIHAELAFSGVDNLTGWQVVGYYAGSTSHEVLIQLYDYVAAGWVTLDTMYYELSARSYSGTFADGSPYFDGGGNALMRLYHPDSGQTAHDLFLDYVVIGHTEGGVDIAAGITTASVTLGTGGPSIQTGAAAPEGAVTAEPGSLYLRTTGLVYIKVSGTGNTGWRANLTV